MERTEMQERRVGAPALLARGSFACALCAAAMAQAPQPFLTPHAEQHNSMSSDIAAIDTNRDGQVDVLTPGLFFGSMLVSIDEHGHTIDDRPVNAGFVPNPRQAVSPAPIAVKGADLDGDGREDFVFVTSDGAVHVQHNKGAQHPATIDFADVRTLDYLGPLLPNSPPFSRITVAAIVSADFDRNGEADLAIGFGVHDEWNTIAQPGLVALYMSDGSGGFSIDRALLNGSVSDLEWCDIDGNGAPDHLVAITEEGGSGAYFQELRHWKVQADALVAVGTPIALGPERPVALEVGDVDLDGMPDYVIAMLDTSGNAATSSVVMLPGDGAGNPNLAMASTLPLPAATGIGSYIPSIQVEDFNGDGVLDVATLRGTLSTFASPSSPSEVGEAEVIVHMGPTPFLAVADTVPLASKVYFGHTASAQVNLRPLWTEPDMLFVIDLGGDGNGDLMITGARTLTQPNIVSRLTLRNGSAPRPGLAARIKVGAPSGGDPSRPARIGFDGPPRAGNAQFACTIQNVRPGCLCTLMWAPFAQQNAAHVFGCDLHLTPQVFGLPVLTAGLAGAGFAAISLPIPNDPSVVGDTGSFQFGYYDPVVESFGASQATGLWIGG